jgi:S-adenosylmethionine-diacylgycerolhomoserine-N-methlytransferase
MIEGAETLQPSRLKHSALLDSIYRHQRFIYNVTRKYYLLGRDQLIQDIPLHSGQRLLEVGTGTARNLIQLHKRAPKSLLYGLDASPVMLEYAAKSIRRNMADESIRLTLGFAESANYQELFGLTEGFDHILFPYSLSMIPEWQLSLSNAVQQLNKLGNIWVVDFWNQQKCPALFSSVLRAWLTRFHVTPRLELHNTLSNIAKEKNMSLEFREIFGGYACIAHLSFRT